jgi:hypothetical protein
MTQGFDLISTGGIFLYFIRFLQINKVVKIIALTFSGLMIIVGVIFLFA